MSYHMFRTPLPVVLDTNKYVRVWQLVAEFPQPVLYPDNIIAKDMNPGVPLVPEFRWSIALDSIETIFSTEAVSSKIEVPRMAVCSGCQLEIADRFILRVHPNMEFHASCLKCAECHRQLDESCTAFVKDGRTYCREDYLRLYATKCARCETVFGRNEMVMRARHAVYHTRCFCCCHCEKRLTTGDEFQLKGDQLYCKHDCEPAPIAQPSPMRTPSFVEDDSWETCTMTSLDPTSSPPLSVRSPKSEGMSTPHGNGFSYNTTSSSGGSGGKKKKDKQTTRVRTVLNENQLQILKKCYHMNPRPDAIMKEQLVEMTGLNARVIRVWFQNKRCKDKKRSIQIRDYHVNAEKERALNHVRSGGVGPMMVPPTTQHMDSLGGPIDITHFQQWGNPMDQPPMHPDAQFPVPPMGYTDLPPDMAFGLTGALPFHDYSPHLHASDLSSPSCSE